MRFETDPEAGGLNPSDSKIKEKNYCRARWFAGRLTVMHLGERNMRRATIAFVFIASFSIVSFGPDGLAQTQSPAQKAVDDAISAAERVCLVGSRYKFEADLKGGVLIKKVLPAGQGQVAIEEIRTRGAPDFSNQEIRRFVDADIRECMAKQWPRVHDVLRQSGVAVPQQKGKAEIIRARVVRNLEVSLETAGSGNGQTDFGLLAVNRSDKVAKLLVHTKFGVAPMLIAEGGRGKDTQEVLGIPTCHWDADECFKGVPLEKWASAIKDNELPFSLQFGWTTVASGTAVNLSFTLLQALQDANGRYSFNAVPVSFVRVPIGD